jgi:hypothetical protein
MSLYNLMHGENPNKQILLAVLGVDQEDGKWLSGRFRDIYLNADGSEITLFTRNGAGNRECSHGDDWYGSKGCKHESRQEETDETVTASTEEAAAHPEWQPINIFIGAGRMYKTGKKVMEEQYKCLAPDSIECICTGCIISYHLPTHPNYIRDYDDDFDCTYAYVLFSVPEKYKELCQEMASGKDPKTFAQKFGEKMAEIEGMTKEQLENSPTTKHLAAAYKPVIDVLKDKADDHG